MWTGGSSAGPRSSLTSSLSSRRSPPAARCPDLRHPGAPGTGCHLPVRARRGSPCDPQQVVCTGRYPTARPDVRHDLSMKLALDIFLVISSLLLMLFILLHRGKGGGLSSLFGGGVQSSLSGSSVVERNLDRVTVIVGVLWLIGIVAVGLVVRFG